MPLHAESRPASVNRPIPFAPQVDIWRKWSVAWLGAVVLALINAMVREVAYAGAVSDEAAQKISTVTLIVLLAAYVILLERRWPPRTAGQALAIGSAWAAATIAFEFLFGHYVAGEEWSELVANYNLMDGRLWVLVPASMVILPEVARRLDKGGGS